MQFIDISQDPKNTYLLGKNEKVVFFMFNRSGDITFELAGEGAEAHIFAFFIGKNDDAATLSITQRHLAPKTVSHALIKSALSDAAAFSHEGLVRIERQADLSDASQESRALLLSPEARASSKPALEILADDVRCRHAAAASSLDPEQLFFAQSRGLSQAQAADLLVNGFFKDALQKMELLGANTENISLTIS